MENAVTKRDDIMSPREFKHTMKSARKRFRIERKAGTSNGLSFRPWAQRTYNAPACYAKLFDIVQAKYRGRK